MINSIRVYKKLCARYEEAFNDCFPKILKESIEDTRSIEELAELELDRLPEEIKRYEQLIRTDVTILLAFILTIATVIDTLTRIFL